MTRQALLFPAARLRWPQMASATAPPKVTFEAHEAGDYDLQQAMRRISVPVGAFALALLAIGFAGGKGGLIGLSIDGVVAAACLAFPLLGKVSWANPGTWLRGLFGEAMVAHLLAMLPDTFYCLHDISVSSNGKRSNIDHLVVGPSGLWVIETKNWKGAFQKRGGVLLYNGHERSDLIQRAAASTFDVRSVLSEAHEEIGRINALIVSTKAKVPERLDFGKAVVVGASDVVPFIRCGRQMLTPQQVGAIARCLGMSGAQHLARGAAHT